MDLAIIADSKDFRTDLAARLTDRGHGVTHVAQGPGCIECVMRAKPCAIFVDLYLGGSSGVEVLDAISRQAGIRCVLMADGSSTGTVHAACELLKSFVVYWDKDPSGLDQVCERLENMDRDMDREVGTWIGSDQQYPLLDSLSQRTSALELSH